MDTIREFELAVIGGGPAGSAAALYGARSGLSCALIEPGAPGSQISQSDLVDNYPGLPEISGFELAGKMFDHAVQAGAEVLSQTVSSVSKMPDGQFLVQTDNGCVRSKALICALGARHRKAGFEGEEKFTGRGVSYCATCDAMFFKKKTVYVIGGGKTACQEALFLSRFATEVIVLVRRDAFRAPRALVEKVEAATNVTVRFSTSLISLAGESMPSELVFKDNLTGKETNESRPAGSFGVFVFVGFDPEVSLIRDMVDVDNDGGVITGADMATREPGLFCAGDMRSTYLRQVITAASDGAIAATAAYRYIEDQFN